MASLNLVDPENNPTFKRQANASFVITGAQTFEKDEQNALPQH